MITEEQEQAAKEKAEAEAAAQAEKERKEKEKQEEKERKEKQKLEKARYWDRVEIPVLDDNQFIMSSLLDENKVFFFENTLDKTEQIFYIIGVFSIPKNRNTAISYDVH